MKRYSGLMLLCLSLFSIGRAQEPDSDIYLGEGLILTSLRDVLAEELFADSRGEIPLYAQLWAYDADGSTDYGEHLADDFICGQPPTFSETNGPECTPYFTRTDASLIFADWAHDVAILELDAPPDEQPATPLYEAFDWEGLEPWLDELFIAAEQINSPALNMVLEKTESLLVDGGESIGDSFAPELGNTGLDVRHYDLALTVDPRPDPPTIHGTATLTLQTTLPALASFTLDMRGIKASAVRVDDAAADFEQGTRKIRIFLPRPVPYGELITVAIDYQGPLEPRRSPYLEGFLIGAMYDAEKDRLATVTEPDTADTWFPNNNHPIDTATYQISVNVPLPFDAVANGELVQVIPHEDSTTYHYAMHFPMASYLAILAVADYEVIETTAADGTPFRHYIYAETPIEHMTAVFSGTEKAKRILEDFFGPYPYDRYGHVVTPMFGSALETQTMTAMPQGLERTTESDIWGLVVHELAHQWFGNTVVLGSWRDIWLNEGFATLAEWLADSARYGPEAYLEALIWNEEIIAEGARKTPLGQPQPSEMFSMDSYNKAAWVLHMLRVELGDETFFALLPAYVEAFSTRPVTTNGFFQFVEWFSNRDLTQFRRQWLEQADIPRYTLYWVGSDSGQGVEFLLCNNRPDAPYAFQLPLRFISESDEIEATFTVTKRAAQTYFYLTPQRILEIGVDPNEQVLEAITVEAVAELSQCPRE